MRQVTKLMIYFLIVYSALILIYSSSLITPFAHTDDYYYLRAINYPIGKQSCDYDIGYSAWRLLGRFIAAELDCLNFKLIYGLGGLAVARLLTITLCAVSTTILIFWCAKTSFADGWTAVALMLSLFMLPGVYQSFMTQWWTPLAMVLALSAKTILAALKPAANGHHSKQSLAMNAGKIACAVLLFLLALGIYPVICFLFFVPTLFQVLTAPRGDWPTIRRSVTFDLFFVGVLAAAYFATSGVVVRAYYSTDAIKQVITDYQLSLTRDLLSKISFVAQSTVPTAMNLWVIYPSTLMRVSVLLSLLSGIPAAFFIWSRQRSKPASLDMRFAIEKTLAVTFILVAIGSPFLLTETRLIYYRIIFILSIPIISLGWWSVRNCLHLLPSRWAVKAPQVAMALASCVLVFGAAHAKVNTDRNASNARMEFTYLATEIARQAVTPFSRVHIIRFVDTQWGFNGFPSINDEFNRNSTTYRRYAYVMVEAALAQLKLLGNLRMLYCPHPTNVICQQPRPPQGVIVVTTSAYGEPINTTSDTIIIDMNVLGLVYSNPLDH